VLYRLAHDFGLTLNEGKTRLIAFGRRIARQRDLAGMQRPETFDFLGFTTTAARPGAGVSR
jgi:RNA-directed DNA polymerase